MKSRKISRAAAGTVRRRRSEYRERRLAGSGNGGGDYAIDRVYREHLLKWQRERHETEPDYRQQILERERKTVCREDERAEPLSGLNARLDPSPGLRKTGGITPSMGSSRTTVD